MLISTAVVIIISANQTNAQRINWTIDFLKSFLQDLFINPLVTTAIQYGYLKLYESRYIRRKPKVHKHMSKYLNEVILEIEVNYLYPFEYTYFIECFSNNKFDSNCSTFSYKRRVKYFLNRIFE